MYKFNSRAWRPIPVLNIQIADKIKQQTQQRQNLLRYKTDATMRESYNQT